MTADFNADGLEDLVVTSGHNGEFKVFLANAGAGYRFTRLSNSVVLPLNMQPPTTVIRPRAVSAWVWSWALDSAGRFTARL